MSQGGSIPASRVRAGRQPSGRWVLYTPSMDESRVVGSKSLSALVPFLVAFLLAGCSSYTAPTLRVTEAIVAERTSQGTVLGFTLDAENSNAVEMPLREVRYTLDLDGQRVFEGFRSPEATIRRFAVQHITLPAVVSAEGAARLGLRPDASGGPIRYRLAGTLTYLTPGEIEEILFDNEIRRPTVSFEDSGEIRLGAVPASASTPTPVSAPK